MSIQNRIPYYLIVFLIAIILLQRSCNDFKIEQPKETIKTDTIWKTTKDTVFKTVNVVKKEFIAIDKPEYKSTESIDTCKTRFNSLLKEHLVRTVYSDTLKLDSLGTVVIRDTVWLNKLHGKREYIKDYKIPFVTKTIIKQEESKRQLYIGGNVYGNANSLQLITPGILYKNKKDQVYQVSVGLNMNGGITYGFGMYYKIKLK